MAKSPQKIPQTDYQAELVAAVQEISKSLRPKKQVSDRALNRASDVRTIGNAVVIGLVVEQAFRQSFDVSKAIAGIALLTLTWVISDFIERGGVE